MSVLNVETPAHLADEQFTVLDDMCRRILREIADTSTVSRWRQQGYVDREAWQRMAAAGLLLLSVPEQYGGGGGDFRHEAVLMRRMLLEGLSGWDVPLHSAIVAQYVLHYGSEAQRQRWLPRLASGEWIGAIAMTEPGAGSDLQALRTTALKQAGQYVINGQKTFISNGGQADFVLVVCKTDTTQRARGMSLIAVETAPAQASGGFRRGRRLEKIGLEAGDTSELSFMDAKVPAENLLGCEEGRGFAQLMEQLPQERLMIAIQGLAMIERALETTLEYVKQRRAFGQRLIDFQNTQFKLAECKTKATIARVFVDYCTGQLLKGRLDAATASMAKYWVSDLQCRVVDECLQLHGGFGYMTEYPIAQMYKDARVQRIYGGANEIMKVLIARTL